MRRTQSSDQVNGSPLPKVGVHRAKSNDEKHHIKIEFPQLQSEIINSDFSQNHFRFRRERRGSNSSHRSSSIDEENNDFLNEYEADSIGLPLDIDDAEYRSQSNNSIDNTEEDHLSENEILKIRNESTLSVISLSNSLNEIGLDGNKLSPSLAYLCNSMNQTCDLNGLSNLTLASSLKVLLQNCSMHELVLLAEALPHITNHSSNSLNSNSNSNRKQHSGIQTSNGRTSPMSPPGISPSPSASSSSSIRDRSNSVPAAEPLSARGLGWLGNARNKAKAAVKAAADGIHHAAMVAAEVAASEAHDFTHGSNVSYDARSHHTVDTHSNHKSHNNKNGNSSSGGGGNEGIQKVVQKGGQKDNNTKYENKAPVVVDLSVNNISNYQKQPTKQQPQSQSHRPHHHQQQQQQQQQQRLRAYSDSDQRSKTIFRTTPPSPRNIDFQRSPIKEGGSSGDIETGHISSGTSLSSIQVIGTNDKVMIEESLQPNTCEIQIGNGSGSDSGSGDVRNNVVNKSSSADNRRSRSDDRNQCSSTETEVGSEWFSQLNGLIN